MAQVKVREPSAALGPDRAGGCPGEPTVCRRARYRGTRRTERVPLQKNRQCLPAAVSAHCSEPQVARGTFRLRQSQRALLAEATGLLPKSYKQTPKLSRTEAMCLQVSMGWWPGASRLRPAPEYSTPDERLQACDTQFPRDSQAPPTQALHPHFLFKLDAEQTQRPT